MYLNPGINAVKYFEIPPAVLRWAGVQFLRKFWNIKICVSFGRRQWELLENKSGFF